jgi:hypothetical protein
MDLHGTQFDAGGPFVLDPQRLQQLAQQNRRDYAAADPYPHVVIDNFLPDTVLERVRAEVPRPGEIGRIEFDGPAGRSWPRASRRSSGRRRGGCSTS